MKTQSGELSEVLKNLGLSIPVHSLPEKGQRPPLWLNKESDEKVFSDADHNFNPESTGTELGDNATYAIITSESRIKEIWVSKDCNIAKLQQRIEAL